MLIPVSAKCAIRTRTELIPRREKWGEVLYTPLTVRTLPQIIKLSNHLTKQTITHKSRGFLSRRDHDFVGEDPVLAGELARRMQLSGDSEPTRANPPCFADYLRLCNEGMLPSFECPQHKKLKTRRQILNEETSQEGSGNQFPNDYNDTNLYAMHLKVAEQAIYSTQMRLKDFENVMSRHQKDDRFRLAYMTSKLETWRNDISLLFDYSHRNNTWQQKFVYSPTFGYDIPNTHQDPRMFSVYKHINYYQLILRRYLDIIYTLELVRDTHYKLFQQHEEEMAQQANLMDPELEIASTPDMLISPEG